MGLPRMANHADERVLGRLAINDPIGVKNFVSAVFGVYDRKHRQLDIGRVAASKGFLEVVDFRI